MPDVEVKLNIEAEYKQALAAISAMGKALEAVQAKAKALTDATKNVASVSGAGGGQNEALTATQKLNEVSKQLAGHLAQVAVASTKAKDSLQAIAGIEPYREESLELINKAAAGYEKLASMAQMAANAAERFRKVGADGLTTEEMVRQTQAAEKQLETLRAQSVELERSIAAQREQLNVLRETTAEQQKQAQVRSAEDKEREKSIAIREREAKAEEEADFKMKLANKTRLELVNIIKELTAKYKEASAARDVEAMQKYERQLTLANQALRKLNMNARVANIAFMQQAQAAQRIGQNLATLTTGFTGFGQALEKGEVNVVGLSTAFVSMIKDLRGGMSVLGWSMLVLQGVQAAYNKITKENIKLAEAEKKNKENAELTKNAYDALATAQNNYLRQQEREKTISDLRYEYAELNRTLQSGLDLINAQTTAEMRRLGLTQDDAQFQRTLKKHELGRQLAEGNITEEQYNLALLELGKETAIGAATGKKKEAEVKANAAKQRQDKLIKHLDEAQAKSEAAYGEKESYSTSFAQLEEAEKELAKLEAEVKSAEEAYQAFKRDDVSVDVLGGLEEVARLGLKANSWGKIDWKGAGQRRKELYLQTAGRRERAKGALARYKKQISQMTDGKGIYAYREDKKTADEAYRIAAGQATNARENMLAGAEALQKANEEVIIAAEAETRVIKQQNQLLESEKQNIESRKKGEARKKREAEKLEELQNIANSLTAKQLEDEIKAAKKDANSSNAIVASEGKKRLAYLAGISNARQNRASKEAAKYLGDNKFTSKEVQAVISKLEEAVYAGEVEKVELYRSILKLGKKVLENKKDTKNINKQLEETAR